jgi:CRISPR-associated protein Cas2
MALMFFLIAYDIANRKRLHRVARLIEGYGERVQKSVFECRLDPGRLAELLARVKDIMNKREDKLQIYQLCENCLDRIPSDVDVFIC